MYQSGRTESTSLSELSFVFSYSMRCVLRHFWSLNERLVQTSVNYDYHSPTRRQYSLQYIHFSMMSLHEKAIITVFAYFMNRDVDA
jgi:hypothetical protein